VTEPGVSGIVLAGGAARRFGADKLAAAYAGEPLLARAVRAVATQASEVVVVVAPGDERTVPDATVPVRRAIDPERHGGPLVGLLAGLEVAREPIALVAGGDMPAMQGEVLAALVRSLVAHERTADAAVLERRGSIQPLPFATRNGAATQLARRLVAEGERSLRSFLGAIPAVRIDEIEWRSLDPEAATLFDVDVPEDLPRT
jgi:molybdopterin-guanine dinucleotide biosynthesis protein A